MTTTFASGRRPARRAVVAAHLAPLVALPSSLWRLGLVFGGSMGLVLDGEPASVNGWEAASVIGLAVAAELTALLTLGLVRPWGERAPAWLPRIGGRRVPPGPVVTAGALGSLALTGTWVGAALGYPGSELRDGFVSGGWEALFLASYAPLLLWGPLVAVATFDYWRRAGLRRRRALQSVPSSPGAR